MKLIITGATGLVGEGVLHEALQSRDVGHVLIVNRKPTGMLHPKLKEVLHADFFNLEPIADQLSGYDACLFCLGVSSVGKSEADFTRDTYDLTMNFARLVSTLNPGMTFCYISGAGTDSSEKGRMMWARVKGKTENDLSNLGLKASYAFRPGFLQPTPGLKNVLPYYKYFTWLFPFLKFVARNYVSTLSELGKAMIHVAENGYDKKVLEVKDIVAVAKKHG